MMYSVCLIETPTLINHTPWAHTGVDSVFSKIGCDPTAITDLLGGHAGVTDTTILQYLGIVEQRTNELLQLQAFIQAKVCICIDTVPHRTFHEL